MRTKRKMKKALAFYKKMWYHSFRKMAGCGAVGSALPWGGRGRKFKSCHSDQIRRNRMTPTDFFMPKNKIRLSIRIPFLAFLTIKKEPNPRGYTFFSWCRSWTLRKSKKDTAIPPRTPPFRAARPNKTVLLCMPAQLLSKEKSRQSV